MNVQNLAVQPVPIVGGVQGRVPERAVIAVLIGARFVAGDGHFVDVEKVPIAGQKTALFRTE
jgi:hypothetical protein